MNYEDLINKIGVAFVIHEVKYGTVVPTWVSDNFEEVLGHCKETWLDLEYKAGPQILHPDDHNILNDFNTCMKEKGFYHGLQRHLNAKTKEYFWVYVNFKPLEYDKHGNISKTIGVTFKLDELLHSQIQTDYFISDHLRYKGNKLLAKLTKREVEIARLVANGFSDKEVADKLHISEHTAKKHRFNILKKLEVNSFMKVAKYFY